MDRSPQLAPIFTECGHSGCGDDVPLSGAALGKSTRCGGGALGKNVWRAHEVRCRSERIDVTACEVRWLGDD